MNPSFLSTDEIAGDHAREQSNLAINSAAETSSLTKETQANPFTCTVCRRSYTRLDHLARHFRSRMMAFPAQQAAG
jgi:hypothetical protein